MYDKDKFYNLLVNSFEDAIKYLYQCNNISLLLEYKNKLNYKSITKINNNKNNIIVKNLKIYYYNKLINHYDDISLFNKILNDIHKDKSIYYLLNNNDILLFKKIEEVIININIDNINKEYHIFVFSDVLFAGMINFISLGKIEINSFIFNDNLYVDKKYYNNNYNKKDFKLFVINNIN